MKVPNRRLSTSLLIAVSALSACATRQNHSENTARSSTRDAAINAACPDLDRWQAERLHGTWRIELPALGLHGQLLLRRHPEFSASLRGELDYGGQRAIASGDLEGGELNLDESRDGKSLHAFWTGQLVPHTCGQEIRGTWQTVPRPGQPEQESAFVLRRMADHAGW